MIGPPKESGERGGVSPPILRQAGLRYHGEAIAPGAQTEHRGGAGPVRDLLGGGHAPAVLIFCHSSIVRQLRVFGGYASGRARTGRLFLGIGKRVSCFATTGPSLGS